MRSARRVLVWLASAAVAVWIHGAQAAIIVSFGGVVAAPGQPGVWNWLYTASLQPDQLMTEQDFFTIYDFPEITASNVSFGTAFSPATSGRTFTTSVQNIGETPSLASILDDPNVPNVTVKLTGGGTVDPSVAPPGPVTLGSLVIQSLTNIPNPVSVNPPPTFNNYATAAHIPGVPDPLPSTDVGTVPVALAVPEPANAFAMIVGLIALGAYSLRRREKQI